MDIKWVEYQNMVKYLSQWIKHNVTVMMDRNFPSNPAELKVRCLKSSCCYSINMGKAYSVRIDNQIMKQKTATVLLALRHYF